MADADPIVQKGEFYPDEIDPMLEAIRRSIVDAPQGTQALQVMPSLAELGDEQVVIVRHEMAPDDINATVERAVASANGLCLLLVPGDATNEHPDAPGPRLSLQLELQLFVGLNLRPAGAAKPMELVVALCRLFHQAQLRVQGVGWMEEVIVSGFAPLEDDDFTAYSISLIRDLVL